MKPLSTFGATQPRLLLTLARSLDRNRAHHAYIMVGREPEATAAIAIAIAAQALCQNPEGQDACTRCPACHKVDSGNHPDLHELVPNDKNVITVDSVRAMRNRLMLRAAEAPLKVVVIRDAHTMKAPAQNALLKTLEEPPGPTRFILTTSRYRSLLATVRSRSQRLQVAPTTPAVAAERLVDQGLTPAASRILAPLVGPQTEAAQALSEQEAERWWDRLQTLFEKPITCAEALELAAELGSSREASALGLALLELTLRDRLAQAWGARPDQCYALDGPGTAVVSRGRLHRAAQRLAELRADEVYNLNRTLAWESLLLELTEHTPQPAP